MKEVRDILTSENINATLDDSLALAHTESFRDMVNKFADEDILTDYIDDDMKIGLVDLYARNRNENKSKQPIRRQALVLLAHLEGAPLSVLAKDQNVSTKGFIAMRESAAHIIASNLKELFHPPISGRFSPEHIERFRRQINELMKDASLEGPLDEDEIYGLIDLYARSHVRPSLVGSQVTKLILLLEGKEWATVAKETNTPKAALHNLRATAIATIARNLPEVIGDPSRDINQELQYLVENGHFTHSQTTVLKRHLGIIKEPLKNGEVQLNKEVCEKLRELTIDAKSRDYRRYREKKIQNAPSEEQLQLASRVFGNLKNAVDPQSPKEMVEQYSNQQKKLAQNIVIDKNVQVQNIAKFQQSIHDAIRRTLEWVNNPKYL